jgi:hypothetical protein
MMEQEPIKCHVDYIQMKNEQGILVNSVLLTCSKCRHQTTAYGRKEQSLQRAAARLRDECPRKEKNFYEIEDNAEPTESISDSQRKAYESTLALFFRMLDLTENVAQNCEDENFAIQARNILESIQKKGISLEEAH